MQRKLKIDGSSLWDNLENQFVLRFNDLNQEKQNKLAQRLKETSQRQKVRNELSGIEEVVSLLKEINPIIYAEGPEITYRWRSWNCASVQVLSGWHRRQLDRLIYRFLCLNRQPYHEEIKDALMLSIQRTSNPSFNGARLRNILSQLPQEHNENPANIIPQEIGITEIQSARETTERRNINR